MGARDEDDGTADLLDSIAELQATVDDVKARHPFDGPVYRAAAIVATDLAIARAAAIAHCEASAALHRSSAELVRELSAAPTPPVLQ